MMHTCAPPKTALAAWLQHSENLSANYGHLLLEQTPGNFGPEVLTALRPYFESAHLDARDVFHAQAGIDLHPDAPAVGPHTQYPNCLPSTTRRGLFGEVIAGLVTESYALVGGHAWSIPIFLFRHHADVEAYLFDLVRDPTRQRQLFGRFGNDFIAISLDSTGKVVRFIAGEAKWRQTITPAVMDTIMLGEWTGPPANRVRSGEGVWFEINRGLPIPRGLRQLQHLLLQRAPDQFAAAILSLDKALLSQNLAAIPRTDLIVVAGDRGATRQNGAALLPTVGPPPEYTAGRPLQVVELVLRDGSDLIDQLYNSLWSSVHATA